MISQEDFEKIVEDVSNEKDISADDIKRLIATIGEMDAHMALAEECIDFLLFTSEKMLADLANSACNIIGLRDLKKRQKIAKLAGQAAGNLAGSIQAFVASKYLAEQNAISEAADAELAKGLDVGTGAEGE